MTLRRIQRFEVLGELGSGGMGTVYRARDPQLEREVAIKVLTAASAASAATLSPDDTIDLRGAGPAASDDLLREARMMARLSHPNVLPVYEVGLADGAVFVVMEYIAGTDLAGWLGQPRPTEQILAAFTQAARGLAAAHAHGIVHRDFKPANVLVGRDGRVRVADFGLSRLSGPPTAVVRIDDGRGTPRYMAPELWQGAAATPASDVFALCAALAEALGVVPDPGAAGKDPAGREHRLSPRLRAALARGTADDPAARVGLGALLGLLEPPAMGRRWLAAVAAVAVLASGAGVLAAFAVAGQGGEPVAACAVDPALFHGRWDVPRRVALRSKLATAPGEVTSGIVAALDARQRAITDQLAAGCAAVRAGQLAAPAAAVRASCLERRAFELGATVERVLAAAPDAGFARDRVDSIPEAADCGELTAPALPADRGPVRALYGRWVASAEMRAAAAAAPAPYIAELTAIERSASALGERELAARVTYLLGVQQKFDDQLSDSDTTQQHVYRVALDMHATNLAANALIERSTLASMKGDGASATQLAQLARDIAGKPTTSMRVHARVQIALGRAAIERGDFKAAIPLLQEGLAIVARSGQRFASAESELRFDLVKALVEAGGHAPEAVRVARETVAVVKQLNGEDDPNNGVALNLYAFALRSADDVATAVGVRRQALAVMEATLPPGNSHLALQHADIAGDLSALGRSEDARVELTRALALSEHNQTMAGSRASMTVELALATFDTGHHDEAIRIVEDGLESTIAQFGKDNQATLDARSLQIGFELELGKLADAARHLVTLEAGCRTHGDAARGAFARGYFGSAISIARGKPAAAERASRAALAALAELHAGDSDRGLVYQALGDALAAQRRWSAARGALDQALALSRKSQQRDDVLAAIEVDLARVEVGLGHRAAARARATRARAVLVKFPGQVVARKQADQLLR